MQLRISVVTPISGFCETGIETKCDLQLRIPESAHSPCDMHKIPQMTEVLAI